MEDLRNEKRLCDAFLDCIKEGRKNAKDIGIELTNDYIGLIQGSQGILGIPVDKLYVDGFMSEGIYYSLANLSFVPINGGLAKKLREKETDIKLV